MNFLRTSIVLASFLPACGGSTSVVGDAGGGEDATSDGSGSDGSVTDGSGTDGPGADAASDAPSDVHDDVNRICTPGTCMVQPGGPCEIPSGPQGNGCCKCTGDYCTAMCVCTAPDTPIATPTGYRPIASLQVGDLVYSENRGALVAVPIRRTSRVPVEHHVVVRATLPDGTVLRISPMHPTADGRTFGALHPGDLLDRARLVDVELVPYEGTATYDILPDSDTGTYVAGGALIGSTLKGLAHLPEACQ